MDLIYDRPARIFHWLTVGLLVASFTVALSMTRMEAGDLKLRVYSWHEWVGITIFALTIGRGIWRLTHRPPPLALSRLERRVANLVYFAMYVVLIVQPIIGLIMSAAFGFRVVYLGILPMPQLVAEDHELAERLEGIHVSLAMVLVGLIVAHLAGVLYHHLIRQDGILRRMLPGVGTGGGVNG